MRTLVRNSIFIHLRAVKLIADHICEVKTMTEERHLTMIRWSGEILVTLILYSKPSCRCSCFVCVFCVVVVVVVVFFLATSVSKKNR